MLRTAISRRASELCIPDGLPPYRDVIKYHRTYKADEYHSFVMGYTALVLDDARHDGRVYSGPPKLVALLRKMYHTLAPFLGDGRVAYTPHALKQSYDSFSLFAQQCQDDVRLGCCCTTVSTTTL